MTKEWQQGDSNLSRNKKALAEFNALLGDNKQPVLFNGEKGTAYRQEDNWLCVQLKGLEVTLKLDDANICKDSCSVFEVVIHQDNGEVNRDVINFVAHKTPLTGSAVNQFVDEINRNIESSKVVLNVLCVDENSATLRLNYEHELFIANPKPTPKLERLIEKAFNDNFIGYEIVFSLDGYIFIEKI